jgi:hypothetical protein
MEVFSDLMVAVDVFIVVDFAIGIEVVEADDLVTAGDVDLVVEDFEAERLEESGGDSAPGELVVGIVDSADDPDVAIPGAEGEGVAVW